MNGVDLAYSQIDTDFNTLVQHVDFCFIKVTEGINILDSQFSHNRQGARGVDLARGYYHVARFDINSPLAEAEWFMQWVGSNLQPGECVGLDFEPANIQAMLANHIDPVQAGKAWADFILEKTGAHTFIYGDISNFKEFNWATIGGCPLWVAGPSYPYTSPIPNFPYQYVIQQYGTTTVPGVNGPVDVDHVFGDRTLFESYGVPAPVQSLPSTESVQVPVVTPVVPTTTPTVESVQTAPVQATEPTTVVTTTPQVVPEPVVNNQTNISETNTPNVQDKASTLDSIQEISNSTLNTSPQQSTGFWEQIWNFILTFIGVRK